MYGVLLAIWGSNSPTINTENGFPNTLNPTQISEWKKGTYKLHQHEIICITIQLLMFAITPLNQMQKD